MTAGEITATAAMTPEGRRDAWVTAGPHRSILKEGGFWVALEAGREIDHHPFLPGLMDLLPEDHKITPVEGSPAQTRPGFRAAPASLMHRDHYPVEAICKQCRMIIRSESFSDGWVHTGRRPGE